MIRRTLALSLVAAFAAAFVAGCGSSSSSNSTSSSSSPSSAPPASSSGGSSSGGSSSGGSSASASPAVQQAVAQCKQSINSQATLSSSEKSKLTALCDKAANGDVAGAKKAAQQVCEEIVRSSVPSSAQQQALAACQKT